MDHKAPFHPYIAGGCIGLLLLILLLYVVTISFLLHPDHRNVAVHKLAANSMLGHLVFSTLAHPMSIHLILLYRPLGTITCWIFRHLFLCYLLITPYTLFMFTIERLIYICNPTTHAQKLGRVSTALMLAIPWVLSLSTGVLAFNSNEIRTEQRSSRQWDYNETMNVCQVASLGQAGATFSVQVIVVVVIGALFPLLSCLIISIIVLIIWCCYKRKHAIGTDYSLLGDQVEVFVRNSVISVSLLNFSYVIVQLTEAFVPFTLPLSQASNSIFGVVEGAILLGTLDSVRKKIAGYWRGLCARKGMEIPTVEYTVKEEDNMAM